LLSFCLFVNRARRAAGVLLTAPDVSAKKDEVIAKEIQEMRDALQAFQTAIEGSGSRRLSEWRDSLARQHLRYESIRTMTY
jgi:hypothetical protein